MASKNYQQFQDSEPFQNYVIGEACNYPEPPQPQQDSLKKQYNYPPQPFQNSNIPQQPNSMISQHQQQFQQQPQQPLQLYYPSLQMPNQMVNIQNQPHPLLQVQAPPVTNYIIQNQPRSRFSEQLYCVNCKTFIPTDIVYKPGLGAIMIGSIIALFGGWLGCCLIPCCLQDCKDAIHTCPKCGIEIGSKQFLTN